MSDFEDLTEDEVPIAGRLEGIGLPDLIYELGQQGMTGTLRIERMPILRTLYFRDGRVVFASSTDPNDRLGEMLLRKNGITLDQLESALARSAPGKRLGMLLVESGALTEDDLVAAVVGQVKSVVLDVLTWEEGEYEFREGPLPTEEVITMEVDTDELLLQGIRNVTGFSRILRGVGPARAVYAHSDDWKQRIRGLSLTEGEKLILRQLENGEQSVEEMCREIIFSNFDIYQMLWAFKVLGVVVPCVPHASVEDEASREGRLDETPFPELLVRLCRSGETGVLNVCRGNRIRTFHVAGGRCVFATSDDPDDGLISYLFRRGGISLQDREEAIKRLLTNHRVGTILRELGVIDDDDLRDMVRQQVGEIVFDTFRWDGGDYVFREGELPSNEDITLDSDLAGLVAEGIKRVGSWTRVIRGCGGMDNPLTLTPGYLDILDAAGAGVAEWEIVNVMKTPQTPRRVCRQTDIGDFHACQIVWMLKLLGAVEDRPVELDEAEPVELPEGFHDAPLPEPATETVSPIPADEFTPEPGPEPAEVPPDSDTEQPEPLAYKEVQAALRELPDLGIVTLDSPDDPESPLEALESPAGETESAGHVLDVEPDLGPLPDYSGPTWHLPEGVNDVIERFNAMHRIVYRAVRAEIGAGAVNFVRSCCGQVAGDATDLVCGVELRADGTWDVDGLKRVILEKRVTDPWPSYQEVLDAEFVSLQPHLGEDRACELRRKILDLENSSTPG